MVFDSTFTFRRPDDWHVHLRDGEVMRGVLPWTARQFSRAIVMPNVSPPVTTVQGVVAYRAQLQAAIPADVDFTPLMTVYLTDASDPVDIARGFAQGAFIAAKLYPAHATTGAAYGVTDIANILPVLAKMQDIGMPLLVHGEVTDPDVDIYDREAVFIDRVLDPLVRELPGLKLVFEHITTSQAVDFINAGGPNIGATITPQHLHINRNAMLVGGIRPHAYCLPVAKREAHRLALRRAATSGNAQYFLGTDSAPHAVQAKESACGCAGIFNAPFAIESYLTVFDEEGALDRFEAFASENGPRFYGLQLNQGTVKFERAPVMVPGVVNANGTLVVPFHAGETLAWRMVEAELATG